MTSKVSGVDERRAIIFELGDKRVVTSPCRGTARAGRQRWLEGVHCGKICRIGNTRNVDITGVVYGIRSGHVITAAAKISRVDEFAICTHLNDETIERAAAISVLHGVRSWKIRRGSAPYDISVQLSVHRYEPGAILIGAADV